MSGKFIIPKTFPAIVGNAHWAVATDRQFTDDGVYQYYDDVLEQHLTTLRNTSTPFCFILNQMIAFHNDIVFTVMAIDEIYQFIIDAHHFNRPLHWHTDQHANIDEALNYLQTTFDNCIIHMRELQQRNLLY